jgi:acyl-CoA dehydrogenase
MSELREILTESITRLLDNEVTKEVLAGAEQGIWPQGLWEALESNGLTRALVAEGHGGAGASFEDVFAIAYALGRASAPVPLTETLAAGWILSQAGLDVPLGPLALIDASSGALEPNEARTSVSGRSASVPWGRKVGYVVVVLGTGGEREVMMVATGADEPNSTGAVNVLCQENMAGEPRDTLVFVDAPIIASAALPASGLAQHDAEMPANIVIMLGALMRAAQMAGACAWVLDTTLTYATDRVQFGRPLAKLQAIQHYLATLASRSAQATMAGETAFVSFDRGGDESDDVAMDIGVAKIIAGDAARSATSVGHQIHGALGFTAEYDLHYRTRRLWCWQPEFGSEAHWAAAIGRSAVAAGADALWPNMTRTR